ncbi:MAG: hypothetical protein HQL82_04700 [Magnetococcales bacterium]|nr:hypothetical protein [Magnetococcales bacterium]
MTATHNDVHVNMHELAESAAFVVVLLCLLAAITPALPWAIQSVISVLM